MIEDIGLQCSYNWSKKQLSIKDVYKQVSFKEKTLFDLVETTNKLFCSLKLDGHISDKEMKYLMYEFKKIIICKVASLT